MITGPFNQHFVRDIGLIFLFVGTSFLAGAMLTRQRMLLFALPTLWLCSHALFHFWEVATGICKPSDLIRDFPAVTAPALIGVLLTLWSYFDARTSACRPSGHSNVCIRISRATVRPMARQDIPELLRMMRALVAFERGKDFRLNEAELLRRGFGDRAEFGAFVAESAAGHLVGFAAYEIPFMHSLQPLLMMKWLYVDETERGNGIGEQLLNRMLAYARSIGHEKFCWFVLKGNARAQKFYRSHGAAAGP